MLAIDRALLGKPSILLLYKLSYELASKIVKWSWAYFARSALKGTALLLFPRR